MDVDSDLVENLLMRVDKILSARKRFYKSGSLIFSKFKWYLESIDRKYEDFEDLRQDLRDLRKTCLKNANTVSISALIHD
jgi:hypothetical protein